MALKWKSAKVSANNSAVALGTGYAKILAISTVGNAGTVYLGPLTASATTGLAVKQDMVIPWTEMDSKCEEFNLADIYVFSAGTDGVSFLYADRG